MAFEFKNLNEIPAQDAPTENTTVMAFENGSPKQIPALEFGGKRLVVDLRSDTLIADGNANIFSDIVYDPIYETITAGQHVVFQVSFNGKDMFAEPVFYFLAPEAGLCVGLFLGDFCFLLFTNGSYHTTA